MVYLMIQELRWESGTGNAGQPGSTKEIKKENFTEGMAWWFEWERPSNKLSACDVPGSGECRKTCTTTLLYMNDEGFFSIFYNPFNADDTKNHWHHWWSLGFHQDGDMYVVERNDTNKTQKIVRENRSGWFHLFQETKHHARQDEKIDTKPCLTGKPSLIWALVAFQFSPGALQWGLPRTVDERGKLNIRQLNDDGRVSQRALVVEVWARSNENVENPRIKIC